MATTRKLMTLEHFLKLPEEKPALEFEEGRVTQKVSPKGRHSVLQYAICFLVNGFAQARRLAFAFPELRTTYGGRSYVPDVSAYLWERIPFDEQGSVADEFFDSPDIAIEIVSPRQSVNRLMERCGWYVTNGVQAALIVNPTDRSIRLFKAGESVKLLRDDDAVELGDVIPGLRFTAGQVFASLQMR